MQYLRICSYAYVAILVTGCATALPSMNSVDPNNLANNQSIYSRLLDKFRHVVPDTLDDHFT